MGLKAAVQALKKAEELKARVSRHNDLLNNSEAWSDQQQLQTVYHQVLVLDLEYALDKKVEQELWTLGFKNHIAALQHLSRDKKNPRRSECQSLLSWCLEAASGFYLTLLQELCSAFELDLPFRRRGAVYGQTKSWPNSEQLTQPHKSSCLYICQYCLVHLGDIARYRSQRKQAETFYRHAILLSPSSGQPYNQLALLEATRGDKLATVFHYVRSISVKHPFPAAATNLSNTLSAMIDNDEPLTEVHSKLTLPQFTNMFLRVHSLLHLATDLNQAELCVKSINATFTALIATGAFSSMRLNQMTAINLYVLRHVVDSLSTNQLTSDELRVKHLVMDLLAGAFSAYLLPIYTMSNDVTLLEYYALPAIKLTLDWIKTEPTVLSDSVFTKRLQIWPSLCKLLNALQSHVDEIDTKNCDKVPLPEDRDLQCFLPLVNAFKELDFTTENLTQDVLFFNKLRVTRLVNLGNWLATQTVDHGVLITATKLKNPTRVVFEPANQQPDPTTELLEELKHFNIKESAEQVLEIKKPPIKTVAEKRGGILKPQGSLERAREEREHAMLLSSSDNGDTVSTTSLSNSSVSSTRSETSKLKRTRQNVAMQALAKKVEENNKQVTFQTEPIVKTKENAPQKAPVVVKQPLLEVPTKFNPNPVIKTNPDAVLAMTAAEPMRMQQPNPLPLPMPVPSKPPAITAELQANNAAFQNQVQMAHAYPNQNYPRPTMNVTSVPFSVPYPNNTGSNLPFHASVPHSGHSGLPFARQQPPHSFNNSANIQNSGFNMPPPPPPPQPSAFDINSVNQNQNVGYQQQPPPPPQPAVPVKEQYTSWMRDDKLPMPPTTWWTNNQKSLPRNFPPAPAQSEMFNAPNYNNSYNMNSVSNSAMGFLQDGGMKSGNMDFNRQYSSGLGNTGMYNNVSMWNSGPNIQQNLQMLLNQSSHHLMPNSQGPQQTFGEGNKMSTMQRENNSLNTRDSNDNQSNSMPGYSLFNSNWAPNLTVHSVLKNSPPDRPAPLMRQQSLFSGPGPSPLERLLEQQRQLRGSKEDT